ncbi:MAG: peptide-methionine (R)-S-oxide reductase MsrB [Chthoniobacterales bacterium]
MNGGRITSEEKSTLSTYLGVGVLVALAAAAVFYFIFVADREVKQVTGFDPNRPVPTDAVLRRRLNAEAFGVVREGHTEMAFQNKYWNEVRPGIYTDVITGEPLFTSADKYDTGLGIPSFSKPISNDLLLESVDTRFDMQRTQLQAKRSKAFLGHRFDDPKSPTGQRYSVNSAALHFIPVERMKAEGYEAYLPLVEKK